MTRYTIRTVGNRSLYRHLYEAIDSESHHRTETGVARRMLKLNRIAARWEKTVGDWGRFELDINGVKLEDEELAFIWPILRDDEEHDILRRLQPYLNYGDK